MLCGIVSPAMYLLRIKMSSKIAFISFIADVILILLTGIFRNRIGVLGISVFIFDLFILVMTLNLQI